jgi:hypothetical protein
MTSPKCEIIRSFYLSCWMNHWWNECQKRFLPTLKFVIDCPAN